MCDFSVIIGGGLRIWVAYPETTFGRAPKLVRFWTQVKKKDWHPRRGTMGPRQIGTNAGASPGPNSDPA